MIKYINIEIDIYEDYTNFTKKEIDLLIEKFKKDKRFDMTVSEGSLFYKESDEQQLMKDYPQLKEIFQNASSLEEYIQWTYGNEDMYIESDNYTFKIKADEIADEIKDVIFSDDNDDIFDDLKQEMEDAVRDAKVNLIEIYLSNLIGELKEYANKQGFKINLANC